MKPTKHTNPSFIAHAANSAAIVKFAAPSSARAARPANGRPAASSPTGLLSSLLLLLLLMIAQVCADPLTLPKGCIGWWPANGNVLDFSGYGNDGTLVNASYDTGEVGQAFSFSGGFYGSYASIPYSPVWDFGYGGFSIELWAKFNSASGTQAFVGQSPGPVAAPKWLFWLENGFLRFFVYNSTGSDIGTASFVPDPSQWYHLAVTRSGSTYKFYKNGTLLSTDTDSNNLAVQNSGAPLTIGGVEGSFWFLGNIDELSIYNRTLTGAEIAAIYNAGAEGKQPPVLTAGPWSERKLVRFLGVNVSDTVDVGTLTFTGGAGIIEAEVNTTGPGRSLTKRYVLPLNYTALSDPTAGVWQKLLPAIDSGLPNDGAGVTDFDLDINLSGTTALLRLRTVASTGKATPARIALKTIGLKSFTSSIVAGSNSPPTLTVAGNAVDEFKGEAGIGVAPGSNVVVDVNGGETRGLHLHPRPTPGAPTTGTWSKGTIVLDSAGNLFLCKAAGTGASATWVKIGN